MSINRVCMSGNLTRDPEVRSTQSGMCVMSMGVAVNDRRKNPATGQWEDYANYIDCTMFGSRAQALSQYLAKGTKVLVEGKLRWSQWERDGQRRSKVEVVVDEIEFSGGRDGGRAPQPAAPAYGSQPCGQPKPAYAPARGEAAPAPAARTYAPQPYGQQPSLYDEDIPF